MPCVIIHTDGACWPNPGGPGGWSAVISIDGVRSEISGSDRGPTTNNRMEIQAAIEALRCLPPRCCVEIVTDSQYLRNAGATWIALWKKRGWFTKKRTPVKNVDLWQALDQAASGHFVKWKWVRSHQLNGGENDRCDALAENALRKVRAEMEALDPMVELERALDVELAKDDLPPSQAHLRPARSHPCSSEPAEAASPNPACSWPEPAYPSPAQSTANARKLA